MLLPDVVTTVVNGPYGSFVYQVADRSWWWSDELYRLYGFEPGEVVPTTELLVAHKHPDEAAVATVLIDNAFASGEPFALWHRVVDAQRRTRTVVSVGEGVRDAADDLVEVRGYMVDVTGSVRGQTARDVDEAVRRSAESRGVIEQAKGVLMAVLDLDEQGAFDTLRRSSQHANVKVRDLARSLLDALAEVRGQGVAARTAVEKVLARDPAPGC